MTEQFDRLLKQKEVAEWIGMSEAWLEQCRFKGVGIPYLKIGRACRYRTSDVQCWLEKHFVGSNI
jgi:predicted DNA-binding transcriptional regulator AlpA